MKYVKDPSIGNRLLKDSVADAGPGKLAQQRSPSRLLLPTQPIQLVSTPNNNRPPDPLESPLKRQRLQKAESILKSEGNDLNDSPTKQLYSIPPVTLVWSVNPKTFSYEIALRNSRLSLFWSVNPTAFFCKITHQQSRIHQIRSKNPIIFACAVAIQKSRLSIIWTSNPTTVANHGSRTPP
jgi:hypothetical protein